MKKIFALILSAVLLVSALPITAYAANAAPEETGVQLDLSQVACLDKDLPHGDTIWVDIAALERDRLPENAQAEDYAALYDEVAAIVTASDEYVDGSLVYAGDTLYWDTPDGMAHGWSPRMRAEVNGSIDADRSGAAAPQTDADASPAGTLSIGEGDGFDLCASDMVIPYSGDNDTVLQSADADSALYQRESLDLAGTGADSDLADTAVTSTAKDIALFAPYHNYNGDIWQDEPELLSELSKTTGGTSKTYNNADATIDAIADSLESCAVVIVYTHGTVDRCGTMYDTRVSNSSYLCLTTGTGITSGDTAWVTGKFGRYRHAYSIGTSSQANNHEVFAVDGTAIANHMDQQAPNNLLWMHSCLTMATDGLCRPLMNNGVGVVLGYSKPVSSYGGKVYTDFFFESMLTGATVSTAARYMKQQAGCDWDPIFKQMDYYNAISTGVAFPVFAADYTPYPGQYSVDGTQTVSSQWRLPFKNDTSFLKRSVINVNILQRIDCAFPFTPNFTSVKLLSGSLPDGMLLYCSSSEIYVRGTPTATGVYSSKYQLVSSGTTYTLNIIIAVVNSQNVDKTYSYSFTSGSSYSTYVDPGYDYFSCRKISGELPPHMKATMTSSGLHIETKSWVNSSGQNVTYKVMAGEYQSLYEIVTMNGTRYMCTIKITVNAKSSSTLLDRTVSMIKGVEGIVNINDTRYFRIEVRSGSLPDGVRPTYSYDQGFCILGTPAAAGTFTAQLRLYKFDGSYSDLTLKVKVVDPSAADCTVRLYDIYGTEYSNALRNGNTTYTLPDYTRTLPDGVRFTEWWCDGKTYKPGDTITVNAMSVDVYALCADIEPISSVGVSGVVAPKAGAAPTYTAAAPSGAFYMVEDYNEGYWKNGVCWYHSGSPMSSSDKFAAGEKYTVNVSLVPKSDTYEFATSGLSGTVNTNPAKAAAFSSSTAKINIYVEYTFTCPSPIVISSVTVTGITEPIAGAAPKEDCTLPSGAGYRAAQVNWGAVTWYNEDGDILNPNTDTFKAGEKYSAQVTLLANDGYEFTESGLTGTINGKDATKSIFIATAKKRIYISRWFTCVTTTVISSVKVTGVTAPAAGSTPAYAASVPYHNSYLVEDYNDDNCWRNGVCWYDWNGNAMSFTDTFVGGKNYTVQVSLIPSSPGYQFATSGLSGTLNGYNATVKAFSSYTATVNIYAQYTFTCTGSSNLILGDTDGDGKVSILDATAIQRHLASLPTTAYNEKAADADEDSKVTILDATAIQRHLASLPTNKNIGKPIA